MLLRVLKSMRENMLVNDMISKSETENNCRQFDMQLSNAIDC